jgi:hypothetical protein
VAVSGCSSSGGGSDLPKSDPTFEGDNSPAMIDSGVAGQYSSLWESLQLLNESLSLDTFQEINVGVSEVGSVSGTAEYLSQTVVHAEGSTTDVSTSYVVSYDNFRDDGSTDFPGVGGATYADGAYAMIQQQHVVREEVVPAAITPVVESQVLMHYNFNAFTLSNDSGYGAMAGYKTASIDSGGEGDPWTRTFAANYSAADYINDSYGAVLNTALEHAWDGTNTTLIGGGTLCQENDNMGFNFAGCLIFAIDIWWAGEYTELDPNPGWPGGGTLDISTIDASASYAYDDTGYTFTTGPYTLRYTY